MVDLFLAVLCLSWPLLIVVWVVLRNRIKDLKMQLITEMRVHADRYDHLESRLKTVQAQFDAYRARYKVYEADASHAVRDEWLRTIAKLSYRNEIEVEVKFIAPLLRFMGFPHDAYSVRVPVYMQWGHEQATKEADWVVYRTPPGGGSPQPHVVVEAKAPGQALDAITQAQARSYAFGLNAPLYVLTNGKQIAVYERGVQRDACVFDCRIEDLDASWERLEHYIGNAKPEDSRTQVEDARAKPDSIWRLGRPDELGNRH